MSNIFLVNGKTYDSEDRIPQPYLINPNKRKKSKKFKKEEIMAKRKRRIHRRKRVKNTWFGEPKRHAKASKKGWSRRRRHLKGYKSPRKIRGRYIRNPFGSVGGMFGDFINMAKDTGLIFVGYAGTNYVFNTFGGKIPYMDKPLVKGVVKFFISSFAEKKIGKNIAMGIAMSGFKDILSAVSPQVAGMLSANEVSGYLPDTQMSGYITNETPSTVSNYLAEAEEEF